MKQIGFASISPNLSYACKFDLSSCIYTALGGLKASLFQSPSVSSTSPKFRYLVTSGWKIPCSITARTRWPSSILASPAGLGRRGAGPCSPMARRTFATSIPRIGAHTPDFSQGKRDPCQSRVMVSAWVSRAFLSLRLSGSQLICKQALAASPFSGSSATHGAPRGSGPTGVWRYPANEHLGVRAREAQPAVT